MDDYHAIYLYQVVRMICIFFVSFTFPVIRDFDFRHERLQQGSAYVEDEMAGRPMAIDGPIFAMKFPAGARRPGSEVAHLWTALGHGSLHGHAPLGASTSQCGNRFVPGCQLLKIGWSLSQTSVGWSCLLRPWKMFAACWTCAAPSVSTSTLHPSCLSDMLDPGALLDTVPKQNLENWNFGLQLLQMHSNLYFRRVSSPLETSPSLRIADQSTANMPLDLWQGNIPRILACICRALSS